MKKILSLLLLLFFTFSCSSQKEIAFIDYEYLPKDSIAFKYVLFNAMNYESLVSIKGGFIHLDIEIDEEGKVLLVENLKYRIFPEDYILSIKEQERLIKLSKEYMKFHNPTLKKARFGYVMSLSKILE